MLILIITLFGCVPIEKQCATGKNGYGPHIPACWPYTPCSDTTYVLTSYSKMMCRPDQDSVIQWEPTNGPRVENEDRVGGVLTCTCRDTP